MIHVTARLLDTFAFIYTSATIMLAWSPPVNQLIVLVDFDSHMNAFLSFASILKTDIKNSYPFVLNRGQ